MDWTGMEQTLGRTGMEQTLELEPTLDSGQGLERILEAPGLKHTQCLWELVAWERPP